MIKPILSILIIITLLLYLSTPNRNNTIPNTISKEAQKFLTILFQQKIYTFNAPHPNDKPAWLKMHTNNENKMLPENIKAANDNEVTITKAKLANIPILDIRPKRWKENRKLIVYLHGGAFTMFSPETTLVLSAPLSHVTRQRVISVGYTTAPFADWQKIQMEIITAIKSLLQQGYRMQDIVMFGDSAGGGLVMSIVLQLRDNGVGLPAAVVLLSPWSDLTDRGDTMQTLVNADPILNYDNLLLNSALAYAHDLNLEDPRISPLYADFRKGFPPTLIIEGTRCLFLSSSVRLYQALAQARQEVILDVHEGMWHGFLATPIPEASIAFNKIDMFIKAHL